MEHRPYPKIGATVGPAVGGEWIATEKIHGANFVIAFDGKRVRFGKRKAWLEPGEAFFGWQLLRSELEAKVTGLHRTAGSPTEVRLFGELFGGGYPHPGVPVVPGLSPVQTGIWYAPSLHWAVFDIVVRSSGGSDEFLGAADIDALRQEHSLLGAPMIRRGPRNELMRLPVRFETRVPALLGIPPITGNMAEGFVLKPAAAWPVNERAVSKHKIAEFDELAFDQSHAFDANAFLELDELSELAVGMVNEARIASARSKVGVEAAPVREEVVLDVLADLEAMFPLRMSRLLPAEEDALLDTIGSAAERALT